MSCLSCCCIWMTFMTPHQIKNMIVDRSCKVVYIHIINMHYMLYIYKIHLCGVKTYDCIFCHRFTDWIRDKHQQVLPCSVLSIPSMVWGALAHLISFSDEQLNSLFKSVMHGQIYTDPICIYNIYIYTHHSSMFCKKTLGDVDFCFSRLQINILFSIS